jgi:hypothetical protein
VLVPVGEPWGFVGGDVEALSVLDVALDRRSPLAVERDGHVDNPEDVALDQDIDLPRYFAQFGERERGGLGVRAATRRSTPVEWKGVPSTSSTKSLPARASRAR